MTEETKHHLFIAGGIVAAAVALFVVYEKANAASQSAAAASSAASQGDSGVSNSDLLAELELGASGVNYSGLSEPASIDLGVQAPNFDADLEAALQTLTSAGLLPGSAAVPSGGSPAQPVQPAGGVGGGATGSQPVVGAVPYCPTGECSPAQRRPVV